LKGKGFSVYTNWRVFEHPDLAMLAGMFWAALRICKLTGAQSEQKAIRFVRHYGS
jgi:hypothetical protein